MIRGFSRDVSTSKSPKILPVFEFSSLHTLDKQINQFQSYSLSVNQSISSYLHIIATTRVKTRRGWIKIFLMIDSGAIYNFVDTNFLRLHQIETSAMRRPVKLLMIDGQSSTHGLVSEEINLPLSIGPHEETTQFHITTLPLIHSRDDAVVTTLERHGSAHRGKNDVVVTTSWSRRDLSSSSPLYAASEILIA
jgi:hypothetical protein